MARVLVVDDYPDVPAAICSLLTAFGHECRGAKSGREGLAVASEFWPDIALIDLDLPDVSGFDVARALRARAEGRPVFLVALTGWNMPETRIKAVAAGFDHQVLKPIDGGIAQRILQLAEARVFAGSAGSAALHYSSRSR
jgi:CheY-like chemotaxis protein